MSGRESLVAGWEESLLRKNASAGAVATRDLDQVCCSASVLAGMLLAGRGWLYYVLFLMVRRDPRFSGVYGGGVPGLADVHPV